VSSAIRSIVSVVGARPNFMKLAPVARALSTRYDVAHRVVHTGQHYDPAMSGTFFRDLGLPSPEIDLEVGSGSHAQQTARIMERLEPVLTSHSPDLLLVYGDVNSTVAAALVAAKLGIRIGHVEAGLRSGDRSMPEEINRIVTDRLAEFLFAPSREAIDNLRAEGEPVEEIHFVGNVMIDSLAASLPAANALNVPAALGVAGRPYTVVTLHRPSNVDDPATLRDLTRGLDGLAEICPVLFPMHPRTREVFQRSSEVRRNGGMRVLEPLSYLEMLGLVASAALVVTDSGGLQEETSYLGVPCLTVRPNTERPVTCTVGTNRLVPADGAALREVAQTSLNAVRREARPIERWDGKTAQRIVSVLLDGARFD
jgi:UDP-N-acetylglucosamine 2-epimerase (non-hydrolysing)